MHLGLRTLMVEKLTDFFAYFVVEVKCKIIMDFEKSVLGS